MLRPSVACLVRRNRRALKMLEDYHTDEISHQCVIIRHIFAHEARAVVFLGNVVYVHIYSTRTKSAVGSGLRPRVLAPQWVDRSMRCGVTFVLAYVESVSLGAFFTSTTADLHVQSWRNRQILKYMTYRKAGKLNPKVRPQVTCTNDWYRLDSVIRYARES